MNSSGPTKKTSCQTMIGSRQVMAYRSMLFFFAGEVMRTP